MEIIDGIDPGVSRAGFKKNGMDQEKRYEWAKLYVKPTGFSDYIFRINIQTMSTSSSHQNGLTVIPEEKVEKPCFLLANQP
jgi:hypothetical protein